MSNLFNYIGENIAIDAPCASMPENNLALSEEFPNLVPVIALTWTGNNVNRPLMRSEENIVLFKEKKKAA